MKRKAKWRIPAVVLGTALLILSGFVLASRISQNAKVKELQKTASLTLAEYYFNGDMSVTEYIQKGPIAASAAGYHYRIQEFYVDRCTGVGYMKYIVENPDLKEFPHHTESDYFLLWARLGADGPLYNGTTDRILLEDTVVCFAEFCLPASEMRRLEGSDVLPLYTLTPDKGIFLPVCGIPISNIEPVVLQEGKVEVLLDPFGFTLEGPYSYVFIPESVETSSVMTIHWTTKSRRNDVYKITCGFHSMIEPEDVKSIEELKEWIIERIEASP